MEFLSPTHLLAPQSSTQRHLPQFQQKLLHHMYTPPNLHLQQFLEQRKEDTRLRFTVSFLVKRQMSQPCFAPSTMHFQTLNYISALPRAVNKDTLMRRFQEHPSFAMDLKRPWPHAEDKSYQLSRAHDDVKRTLNTVNSKAEFTPQKATSLHRCVSCR